MLTKNLSFIRQPCVLVAATVVSEINERLSPKNEPPTTIPVINGRLIPVFWAMPTAMGMRATMVPTLVPMERDMRQAARKMPGSNKVLGSELSVKPTMASMLPICLAELAKAPAKTNIHSISIMLLVLAPLLNTLMRSTRGLPVDVAMAYILEIMKATVMGIFLKSPAIIEVTRYITIKTISGLKANSPFLFEIWCMCCC